jgi:hypothetical protein
MIGLSEPAALGENEQKREATIDDTMIVSVQSSY